MQPSRAAVHGLVAAVLFVSTAATTPAAAQERILALAPHVVETLYAIGAGDQIVGAVSYADHPREALELPRVGNYRAIAVEAAIRLEPTLAIAMDDAVVGIDQLRAFGVRVVLSHPSSVEGTLADIESLGRLVGHDHEAQRLIMALRVKLERLRAARPGGRQRIFYEIWHDPLIAAGGRSFLSDALAEIGAVNVFADVDLESPRISVESVVRAKPDAIVIPGEARDFGERQSLWREWFPNPDVVIVEGAHDLLHRPGPRLIDGLLQLQNDLARARDEDTP